MRIVSLASLVVVLVVTACASGGERVPGARAAATTSGAPRDWVSVENVHGAFRASFPGVPETSTSTIETDEGPFELISVAVEKDGVAYMIGSNAVSSTTLASVGAEGVLENARDGALGSVNGRLSSERSFLVHGHRARDITAEIPDEGLSFLVTLVLAESAAGGPRLYQILIVKPAAHDLGPSREWFVGSFEVLER